MILHTVMNSDGQLTYGEVKGWTNERIALTNKTYGDYWERVNKARK